MMAENQECEDERWIVEKCARCRWSMFAQQSCQWRCMNPEVPLALDSFDFPIPMDAEDAFADCCMGGLWKKRKHA